MIKKFLNVIFFKDIFDALFVGLKCCFKKPVTKKLSQMKRSDNFRGPLEVDINKCIKCGLCQGVCPNKSVKLVGNEYPIFDNSHCCYCDLCKKACPKFAIKTKHN